MKLDIKMIIILLAVVLVATIGSAYVTSWVFSNRSPVPIGPITFDTGTIAGDKPFKPELVWDAGPFTVNLATQDRVSRFIKTGMSYRVDQKETFDELEKRRVQVRDRVITILRTTPVQELGSTEGITLLKQRIMDEINELIIDDGGRVQAVYLTELVIQ